MIIEQRVQVVNDKDNKNNCQTQRITYLIKNDKGKLIYEQPVRSKYQIPQELYFHPNKWSVNDFQVGRRLGKGKYGYVYLVREKRTKMILVLKILQKSKILKEDVIVHVRRQIQIHSHLKHPNILKMYGFFYDQNRIYIMLQYATRGDLYQTLKKSRGLGQQTAQKYMKQIVSAFIYLQSLNIIHRDIKPENILVSSNNTLKLSDFGFSIKTKSKNRNTFCGTLDYFSPQIVNYKPFNYKVDNWSLGILAYQLATFKSPFYANTKKQFYNNILYSSIKFPQNFSSNFRDFIQKLTRKKASQRMELTEVINHPWLKTYDQGMELQNSNRQFSFQKIN